MLEVEAKFQVISPVVFDQIRSQEKVIDYTLSERFNISQLDTYFDTTTGTFLRQGASFRLRQKGLTPPVVAEKVQLVTFKTQTEEIYTRTELEMPITDQQMQMLLSGKFEKIHVKAVEAALSHLKGEKIFPVLHVENTRETWRVNSNAGCVEVCLDNVQYADMDKTQSVQEYGIELELKEGEAAFLQQIADALSQQYDLIPVFQSKYERGIEILNAFADSTEK